MQPIITAKGILKEINPQTGQAEAIMRPVNTIHFKSSCEVDGGIISEISVGRDGAKIKLESRQEAYDRLVKFFDWNPDSKYKREFDEKRLQIERDKLELDKKAIEAKNPPEELMPDDGFLAALEGKASEVWSGEDDDGDEESSI
jgi:phage terminase small subunit